MKKTLEYLYIFSKLSTSFILLFSILVLGYFFYASFENQEKSKNDQLEFINKLNYNTEKLSELSKKLDMTDASLNEIKQISQKNSNTNSSEKINLLNKKIEEIYLKLENISINLIEIESQNISKPKKAQLDNSNIFLDKNKTELVELIIFKFENSLDFNEELNLLKKLNGENKQHVFEKINLVNLKTFRGSAFMKIIFSEELDVYLKENFNNKSNNFISKSIMRFVSIEPTKKNKIKHNEINSLDEVRTHLDQKNYIISLQKIININNYEKYFTETINQIKIIIEFEELIKKVS